MVAITDQSARIQELEEELVEVRAAFEDYIASSRELENGLDTELQNMSTLKGRSSSSTLPIKVTHSLFFVSF